MSTASTLGHAAVSGSLVCTSHGAHA